MDELRQPLLPKTEVITKETSFINPAYKGYYEKLDTYETGYNTPDNSNLIDGKTHAEVYTEPGNPPSAELTADLLKRAEKADELDEFKKKRVIVLDKSLSKAAEWKYTKTGLK